MKSPSLQTVLKFLLVFGLGWLLGSAVDMVVSNLYLRPPLYGVIYFFAMLFLRKKGDTGYKQTLLLGLGAMVYTYAILFLKDSPIAFGVAFGLGLFGLLAFKVWQHRND